MTIINCTAVSTPSVGYSSETLAERFLRLCRVPHIHSDDIHEHLPMLSRLAGECEHITEFGTRDGASATAFLAGEPATLVCCDIERRPDVDEIMRLGAAQGTEVIFRCEDTRAIEIEETDLLFIDTAHTFEQVMAELWQSAEKARKYIAFHDTVTFGVRGDHGGVGILPAISIFLANRPHWQIAREYSNCNGLTVLMRGEAIHVAIPH